MWVSGGVLRFSRWSLVSPPLRSLPFLQSLIIPTGILTIFAWRIIAKSLLHVILPPTFRLLSRVFRLPNRRHYTPATDYKNMPNDAQPIHVTEAGEVTLRPIPSVIDLPGRAGEVKGGELKMRKNGNGSANGVTGVGANGHHASANGIGRTLHEKGKQDSEHGGGKDKNEVKHYDADGECVSLFFRREEMSLIALLSRSRYENPRVRWDRGPRFWWDAYLL